MPEQLENVTITHVKTYPIAVPIHDFADAHESISTSNSVVVVISTDSGHTGIGESCAWEPTFYGETLETVELIIKNYFTPILIGHNPCHLRPLLSKIDRAVAKCPGAKEGVDLALHDLVGKILSVPVCTLLGGRYRDKIPIASELGIDTKEAMIRNAKTFIKKGINVLKLKGSHDIRGDIDKVQAVRGALGNAIILRLDPNCSWGVNETIEAMKVLDYCNLEFLEQPINPQNIDGLAKIRKNINTPLMADESIWLPGDVVALAHKDAVDIVNIKLAKTGGLFPAKSVEAIAEAYGLSWGIGNEIVPGFTVGAKLHLTASMKHLPYACEFTELSIYKESIIKPKVIVEDGYIRVPDSPGLGFNLDEEALRKYSMKQKIC